MQALVSIVIPMYNCQLYVEKCIRSLLVQTYRDIEIIIVDDGSSDDGAQIVKKYVEKDNRIKYIYQKNSGPGVARNNGIKEARGKYLLFVDADDYIKNNYIKDLVEMAEKEQSELVLTGYTLVYENGKKEKKVIPKFYKCYEREEWVYRISACCSRLYLKEFWDKYEIEFNEERNARAEDVPIALFSNVMAKNISIVKSGDYFYYQHSESAMNDKKKKVLFEFPYNAFKNMYEKVSLMKKENSEVFFQIGILKFLAQFDLVIYRKADKTQKNKFKSCIKEIIGNDFEEMVQNWNRIKYEIRLPLIHKFAIEVFVKKYRVELIK